MTHLTFFFLSINCNVSRALAMVDNMILPWWSIAHHDPTAKAESLKSSLQTPCSVQALERAKDINDIVQSILSEVGSLTLTAASSAPEDPSPSRTQHKKPASCPEH